MQTEDDDSIDFIMRNFNINLEDAIYQLQFIKENSHPRNPTPILMRPNCPEEGIRTHLWFRRREGKMVPSHVLFENENGRIVHDLC